MAGFLNTYFGFNRQQRNGILVLLALSLLLLIVRITYPYFLPRSEVKFGMLEPAQVHDTAKTTAQISFDPNTASESLLVAAGVPAKVAVILMRYRKKHRFARKEELQQVYGVTPSLYKTLEPFITIESTPSPKLISAQNTSAQQPPLELNGADSAALVALPGIGPVFAKRIIKYRELLGGFVEKTQLKEVYGFPPDLYSKIEGRVTVDRRNIKHVQINTDDFKTVNRHPYISYELTKEIFNARRKGPVNEELFRTLAGRDSLALKALPYLSF